MSIVEKAQDTLEDRVSAVAGAGSQNTGFAVVENVSPNEIGRKLLYGFVDDPATIDELLTATEAATISAAKAMFLSGPQGAMGALMLAMLQSIILGILIGRDPNSDD